MIDVKKFYEDNYDLVEQKRYDRLYRKFAVQCYDMYFDNNVNELTDLVSKDEPDFLSYMNTVPPYCYFHDIITEIDIPENIDVIGVRAFEGCHRLQKVELHDGLLSIDESAFKNCGKINEIIIPKTVYNIGSYAFEGCDLYKIVLPKRFKDINIDYCFGTSLFDPDTQITYYED